MSCLLKHCNLLAAQSVFLFLGFSLYCYIIHSQIMSIYQGWLSSWSIYHFNLGHSVITMGPNPVIYALHILFLNSNDVPITIALFSYCCYNKLPENHWFKIAQSYDLIILEVRSLKRVSLCYSQGDHRTLFTMELWGIIHFFAFSSF